VKIIGKPVVFSSEIDPLLKDEEKARKALEIEFALCEEESIVGFRGHLHIVARKPRTLRTFLQSITWSLLISAIHNLP